MAEEILSGRISPIGAVGGRAGAKPALIKPQQPEAFQLIDNDLKQLGEYHKAQYERARTPEEAAQWQAKWDEIKVVRQRDKNNIAAIQQLADSGGLTPERARALQFEIATGINLPTEREMTVSAAGLSPGQSQAWMKKFSTYEDSVVHKPWLHRNYVDKDKLKDLYERQFKVANLSDPRNVADLAGFNEAFYLWASELPGGSKALEELLGPAGEVNFMSHMFGPMAQTDIGRGVGKKLESPNTKGPLGKAVIQWSNKVTKPAGTPATGMTFPYVPKNQRGVQPRKQFNQKTGQYRVSYDGGKTWQIE